jgi:hypothetical protein
MFDEALMTKLLCVVPLCQPSVVGNAVSGDRGGRQRDPWIRDLFGPRLSAGPVTIVPEVAGAAGLPF